MHAKNHFDPWSLLVIVFTLGLFLIALFAKGITHDLDEIHSALQNLGQTHGRDSVLQPSGSRSDARPLVSQVAKSLRNPRGPSISRKRVSGAPSTGVAAPHQPRAYPLFQQGAGTEALTIGFLHDFLG